MNLTQSTALVLAAMIAGCATPINNVRFYSLANPSPAKSQVEPSPSNALIAIEVLPVNVPERLKRPQLVITSKNTTQLRVLEQDRWSSAFNEELQDAFVSGISSQLDAIDVSRAGRIANQPTYRIAIVLQQFSATPDEQVQANFGWTITHLNTDAGLANNGTLSCQATISKTVGSDMNAVVKGVQEMVADAIQAISANVRSVNNGETGKCSN